MRPPRSASQLVIGSVAIFSLACGSFEILGPGTFTVDGSYSLQTVNGAALPVTVMDSLDGVPVQITFMAPTSFTLAPDHSVRIITTVRFVFGSINEVQTDTTTGTYALNGQQVTFSQPGSASFTATWDILNTLTIVDNGVFVFKK